MPLILYDGEVVAVLVGTRARFSPRHEALDTDPLVRFVLPMVAYAFAAAEGTAPGPYSDRRCELFARMFLIDDDDFLSFNGLDIPGELLAGHFAVPVDQIDKKRRDLRGGRFR